MPPAIPESVIFWGAVGAMGAAFAGLAWMLVNTIRECTDTLAAQVGAATSREFEDVFMFVPPERIARIGRLGALFAFCFFFIPLFNLSSAASTALGLAFGLAAGAFAFTLPRSYVQFLRERRRLKFNEQLVEQLGTMSNALRAGFSLTQAFESVVKTGEKPIAQEFGMLLQQLRVGMSFDDALASLDKRIASDDLTLVCTSIDISRRTGGNLTEIFDKISETIRGRMRIERRVRTLTAQGRMQGIIVSAMPFLLALAMLALKPEIMKPFLFSVKGMACVMLTIALVGAGWMIIRKIIKIEV